MLATKPLRETTPSHKSSSSITALVSKVDSHPSAAFDLEFLQELRSGKVLDRLKEIFHLVKAEIPSHDRAIRLPEVLRILGIGKSSWYERLNPRSSSYDPSAPQPFKLGNSERSPSVWWHSEIIAYLETRAATSRNR